MKSVLGLAIVLLLAGVRAQGQEEAAYAEWMKSTSATANSLAKNLEAKAGDAVAADARKLEQIFGQVRAFWEKRNASDAVEFASNAQAGFKSVADLAAAGKLEEASEALTKARANCGGCHNAHRERGPDGAWKIK
ncbi:MAG TPA: hypothetical protein VNN17_08000 [Terriglobia bacterium]|nr:hypothetical protein [Terriglobia bacterium]